jgi:methylated-DNA-protein-cysteine methyltransferase-like protein
MISSTFESVYRVVELIPPGRVATYGQIARLLGMPRGARTVGWALRSSPQGRDVPWQRVINSRGRISFGSMSRIAAIQRALLEEEGIVFGKSGSIDLDIYGWEGLDPTEVRHLLGDEHADAPHA